MSTNKFSYVLKLRREAAGLSQLQLAKRSGICNKRLSAFEKGRRVPTADEHRRLSEILGSLPPALTFEQPAHNDEWRELFRDNRAWEPEPERSLYSRLSTAREAWPELMSRLEPVVRKHEAWLERAPFGSALELLVCLLLLEAEAVELRVRLLAWGFRQLPVVDPRTGEGRGDFPYASLGVLLEEGRAVLVVQPGLLAGKSMSVDFLVGLSSGNRRYWLVMEANGRGHLSRSDRSRQKRHGMEVLAVTEEEILAPDFVARLLRRLSARAKRLAA